MSQISSAMTWLAGRKKAWDSQSVTYRRGTLAVTLQATLGSVLLKTSDARGNVKVERTDRDFVFTAADLTAGGIDLPPQREDVIDATIGSNTERFKLLPYGPTEPLWRWVDAHETMIRVHGKYQGNV